jgi:hypothetical protein
MVWSTRSTNLLECPLVWIPQRSCWGIFFLVVYTGGRPSWPSLEIVSVLYATERNTSFRLVPCLRSPFLNSLQSISEIQRSITCKPLGTNRLSKSPRGSYTFRILRVEWADGGSNPSGLCSRYFWPMSSPYFLTLSMKKCQAEVRSLWTRWKSRHPVRVIVARIILSTGSNSSTGIC